LERNEVKVQQVFLKYINDTAIQYYAITNSGIELKDISIVYINNQYIKKGDIDVKELFTVESVLDRERSCSINTQSN
jgi:hypothetical protein